MNFMQNIVKEKKGISANFLPNISVELLMDRLKENFQNYKDSYESILFTYILNLDQELVNRIYFKNNLYEFSQLHKIHSKLYDIILRTDEFKNPSKVPDGIKDDLEKLWGFYKEFVFYDYSAFNRIQRLKNDVRKATIVIDTDSNMLNLHPWVQYIQKYIISNNDRLLNRDYNVSRFISINIMCFFMTNMITEVLYKYCKQAHVPKSYRPRINMKNEYLFVRLILSPKKKRYIGSIRLREGKEIYPEKIQITGHDFVKSTTREATKKFFTELVRTRLLEVEEIDVSKILRELEKFEGIIRESLLRGEKDFLLPKNVKELGAYKDAYREAPFRGVITFNYLYPDQPIQLPEKIDIIKVNLETEKDLLKLKETDERYYDIIREKIFNNPDKRVSSKGVQVIALPRNFPTVPEWIRPYINIETIVNDNLSRVYSVLNSLGIELIKTSRHEYFSNLLSI